MEAKREVADLARAGEVLMALAAAGKTPVKEAMSRGEVGGKERREGDRGGGWVVVVRGGERKSTEEREHLSVVVQEAR